MTIDWDRRHPLMRTHTALHVLCGVIWNEWGTPVTGGNMEPLAARMDFEFDPLPEGSGPRSRSWSTRSWRRPDPVEVSFLPRAEAVLDADLIRTKVNLVPESVAEIRVVDIVGLDKQADGGTHVQSHRRGGPRPGGEDRVERQGQQADPPPGGRRLMTASDPAELTALRAVLARRAGWWWPSAAGWIRRCWPGSPTTSSDATGWWR